MEISDLDKFDESVSKIVKHVLKERNIEKAKQLIVKLREYKLIGLEARIDDETRSHYES